MYRESLSLKVDPKRCIGCGCCMKECVNNVLEPDPVTVQPRVAQGGEQRCIHCAHCVMACPSGALSIDGIDPDQCEKPGRNADFEPLLEQIKKRRSVRHYQKKNVPPAVLDNLIDALTYPPTGVNYGKLHFSVIRDSRKMDEFRDSFYEDFFARFDNEDAALWKKARQAKQDIVFRSAPHLIAASYDEKSFCGETDCIIALSYFEMLANALGLGTVWFGRLITIYSKYMPDLADRLKLPAGYKPGYAMLFGYSAAMFYRTLKRPSPGITYLD